MGVREHDEVSHATWRRAIAGTVGVVALLLGACSGDDGDETTGDEDDIEGVTPASDAQASADDVEAVTGYVEDLLAGYEEAVNAILVDQQATLDETSPEVEAYRAVFEPDSEAVAEALQGWQANANAGVRYRPTDPDETGVRTWLAGELEVVSENEVTFPTCDEQHMETLQGDRVVETIEITGMAGEGVAVRVGGRWYLRDLELLPDAPPCGDDGDTDSDDSDDNDDGNSNGGTSSDQTEGP